MKSDSSLSNWAQETNNIRPVTIGGNVSVSYRQVVLCSTNGEKSQFFQASLNYLNCKKFLCLPRILSIIHCVFPASSQMRISLVTQYQFGTRIALICVLKQVGIPLEKNSKWPLNTYTHWGSQEKAAESAWMMDFHNINGSWLYTLQLFQQVYFSLQKTTFLLPLTATPVPSYSISSTFSMVIGVIINLLFHFTYI